MKTFKQFALILALAGFVISGCKSMNRTQKGAVIGTAGG